MPSSDENLHFLFTGFEPFDGMTENLSEHLMDELVRRDIGNNYGFDATFAVLPVSYCQIKEKIDRLLDEHEPHAVFSFGIGRSDPLITIERVALNLDDADCADNSGETRCGQPIQNDGPPAIFSNLPLEKIRDALTERSIENALSNHAGTFLCNHLLYELLTHGRQVFAGFFHLPRLPSSPSLVSQLAAAAECIAQTTRAEIFTEPRANGFT